MIFSSKPVATIKGKDAAAESISIPGVTTDSTTPENAAAQINKILSIVGKEINTVGMTRVKVEEATNNG